MRDEGEGVLLMVDCKFDASSLLLLVRSGDSLPSLLLLPLLLMARKCSSLRLGDFARNEDFV